MSLYRGSFVIALASVAHTAPGAIMTYIHEGSGVGSLDGVTFTGNFTITATADSANIVNVGGVYFVDHDSAIIEIDGVGSFEFTTNTRTFVNNDLDLVGFSRDAVSGSDLTNGPTDLAFDTYSLDTQIGPIT